MSNSTNQRKMEHVRLALEGDGIDRRKFYFDSIRLKHRALPQTDLASIQSGTTFLGKPLSLPLLISSMTGGGQSEILEINKNLAMAAESAGVALAVGSQRVMFEEPAARKSFELRAFAPTVPLLANLGAVQLNYGFGIEQCREAVDILDADALCLHLNAVQEAVQPEGNTNFSGLADKIGEVAEALDVPVIVKEVGAGMAREDVELLMAHGIRYIDVAGAGGTSWSRIEEYRSTHSAELGLLFQDWGHPTPLALKQLHGLDKELLLIGSGGIRSGIDMVKAMIIGASLCGIARPFLSPAMESYDAVVAQIDKLKAEFSTALFLLGVSEADSLIGHHSLILDWPSTTEHTEAPDRPV